MELLSSLASVSIRTMGVAAFLFILLVPAWWLAGRLEGGRATPFFRLLCAIGFALTGYLTIVNLVGRVTRNSNLAILAWLLANLAAGAWLFVRDRKELAFSSLARSWRSWLGPVLLGAALGVPQWLLAVSTPFWDEVASSAIHITTPNQFAEGLFPPRHNAFPDLPIKYHYGSTVMSGTVRWLTGLSANASIDIVSTALWLFVFLFVYFWIRELQLPRAAAAWGSVAVLLGGGLAWLYLPRLEAYRTGGYSKVPPPAQLLHRYEAGKSWLANVAALAESPSLHLRNPDGSLSSLPWDIAAQFQQHAVALGIALTLVALYLFTTWQARRTFHAPLLLANIVAFSVLFLAHAVFGGVGAVTAGCCLLGSWLRERTRIRFLQGLCFVPGVYVLAMLHGGMLARGSEYGSMGFTTIRKSFGYASGGFPEFLDWNLAGFGVPLLLAIVAWGAMVWQRSFGDGARGQLAWALSVFAVFSYMVPQVAFYSSDANGAEEFTEISKFFFCTHFALALLSAFGIAFLLRFVHWGVLLPGIAAMVVLPLAFCHANAFEPNHAWKGFYHSPYVGVNHVEVQMANALRRLKKTNHDVYFDASADETKRGFLSALLIYGGSAFTLTPTRYERNGVGYRISEDVVAQRLRLSGRMARLLPGAAEAAGCNWFYSRPVEDMAFAPVIVRSRFAKLVAEGRFVKRFTAGARQLFSVDGATADLDRDLELHWRPRIVSQSKWDADGMHRLVFYDHLENRLLVGDDVFDLPPWLRGEFAVPWIARLDGADGAVVLLGWMKDTDYRQGRRVADIIERNDWGWARHDLTGGAWHDVDARWSWTGEMPLVAAVGPGGTDAQIAYRPATGEWLRATGGKLTGPVVDAKDLPVPLTGKFLDASSADIGLWSKGFVTLTSVSSGRTESFRWGGRDGDVLVPGDYDGDGRDEIAVWQRTNRTWYWRQAPKGPISQATFGTDTCIPIPADYDHDGTLDLAYWEPREGRILVSYTHGRSVDLTVTVPPHALPVFVNWQ